MRTDIDLLVPATAQAGQRTKDALMVLPDRAAKDIDPKWFEEGGNIRVADAFVVDIMLDANGQTFDAAGFADEFEISDHGILRHFVAEKFRVVHAPCSAGCAR